MSHAGAQKGLTALLVMNTLDETERLQFFQRAIDGHQPQAWVTFAGGIIDFYRCERPLSGLHDFGNSAAGSRQTTTGALQLVKPGIVCHLATFLKTFFNYDNVSQICQGKQSSLGARPENSRLPVPAGLLVSKFGPNSVSSFLAHPFN